MATYDNADVVSNLNSNYKEIYSKYGIQDLVPEASKLQKLIAFEEGNQKLGAEYKVPVVLAMENGITFGGTSGSFYALNNPQALQMGAATVISASHTMRSGISYDAASRASNGKDAAFENTTTLVMENMLKSLSKFVEVEMLYGQADTGLAAVASVNSINATTIALTIGQAEWAAGAWSGTNGVALDLVNSANATVVNTNAQLTVSAVNIATKTVTVTGNSTDVTAITTLYGASGAGYLVWNGALTKTFIGLNKAFKNTTGSLFGIDASQYDLWAGNVVNVAGNLTIDGVGTGLAAAQSRGLDGDVELFVSPVTWKYLNDQTAVAQRVFDKSYDPAMSKTGAQSIEYHTQSGVVRIHSHIYVKQGEGYAFSANDIIRVGSAKAGFNAPGGMSGDIFFHAPNNAGFEVRAYADEAILPLKPAACTLFTGITNS